MTPFPKPVEHESGAAAPAAALERRSAALEIFLNRHKLLVLVALSIIYFVGTAARARGRVFWYDEIFTLTIAQQPTLPAVVRAWRRFELLPPYEQMPPFIHLVTHVVNRLFGAGEVVSRLPGMVGFWVFCLCMYRFTVRRVGVLFALAALLLPFATAAYGFSFEARCYGALLGFGGLALVCWQAAADGKKRALALMGLALAIVGALFNHYYAVFLYLPLAGGEALRSFRRRAIDWPVWLAFAAGSTPLAILFSALRNSINNAQNPWARASFRSYLDYYQSQFQLTIPFLVLVAALLAGYFVLGDPGAPSPSARRISIPDYEMLAAALFLAIPVAAISVALVIPPHMFTDRYAILGVAGLALLAPLLGARLAHGRSVVAAVFVIAALGPFLAELAQAKPFRNPLDGEPILRQALQREPVAVGNKLLFLQLWYYAPADLKPRILYLSDEASSVKYFHTGDLGPDAFAPYGAMTLRYREFAAPGKEFLVYLSGEWDWLPQKIVDDGGKLEVLIWRGKRSLIRALIN
jgi:hypothetical protein